MDYELDSPEFWGDIMKSRAVIHGVFVLLLIVAVGCSSLGVP